MSDSDFNPSNPTGLADVASTEVMQLGDVAPDSQTKDYWLQFQTAISKAGNASRTGIGATEGLRGNDTLYPTGKARLIAESTQNASTIAAAEHAKADLALAVWEAHLQSRVFAHDPKNDASIASELSNFAYGVKQGDPEGKLIGLAARPRYATAMAGELGESLAARFGVGHQSLVDAAFRGLAKNGTPVQQAAAKALIAFPKARRVYTLSVAGADNAKRSMQTPDEQLGARRA